MRLKQRKTVKKWLEDLRSGKFDQVTNDLRGTMPYSPTYSIDSENAEVGFCCLGVLCDRRKGEWNGMRFVPASSGALDVLRHSQGEVGVSTQRDSIISVTPESLFHHWTGLGARDGEKFTDAEGGVEDAFSGYLASLNDGGKSFKQIAQVIERRANKIHPGWQEGL